MADVFRGYTAIIILKNKVERITLEVLSQEARLVWCIYYRLNSNKLYFTDVIRS